MRTGFRDLPLLVIFSGIAGVVMLVPAIHATAVDDEETARAFFYAAIVVLMMTGLVAIVTSNFRTMAVARSHLVALVGAYALLPLIFALPFSQAVPDTSFANAWFEMVSCFTTTGATLYDVAG
ncbi:MAG: TrkH family potassium uptake protein, partial [Paracoccaceae bacterium]